MKDVLHLFPRLGADGTNKAPSGDGLYKTSAGEMSRARGKLTYHEGGHVVPSPGEAVLVTSLGTASSNLSSFLGRSYESLTQLIGDGLFATKEWSCMDARSLDSTDRRLAELSRCAICR